MQMNQTETRNHRIKCDFGMTDYYKFYRSIISDPVKQSLYRNVLNDYLLQNKQNISNTAETFRLPEKLGRIEVRKNKTGVEVGKNGEIINKLPINWKATNKLWAENPDAKKRKIKIRYTNEHTNGYTFKIRYFKNTGNYKHKSIYSMHVNREMRRNLENPIIEDKIDAYLLKPKRL